MLALPCPPLQSLLILNTPPKFPFVTITFPWPDWSSWPSCVFDNNSHVTHVTNEFSISKITGKQPAATITASVLMYLTG